MYGIPVGTKLKEILEAPALELRFRNDAEAAILGEALYGSGVPYSRLIGITLGTGLGSAFIVQKHLVTDGEGIPPHGWLYSCMFEHRRADDVFSTRGLLARLRERGIRADDLPSALQATDSALLAEVFVAFGADLGRFLEPFVSNFGPEAILIAGGIANAWERFAPSLRRALPVPVVKGTLDGQAALLGAAALYS